MPGGNWGRPGGGMPPGGAGASSYGEIYIIGGDIYIDAGGDSIDSNGKITMSSGNLVINGSANGSDDVVDYDSGFYANGGTIMATGVKGVSTKCASSGSTQYNVLFTSGSKAAAGTSYEVKDASGNVILQGTTGKSSNVYLFSSDRFSEGTYTLYLNGTSKGSVTFSNSNNNYTVSI